MPSISRRRLLQTGAGAALAFAGYAVNAASKSTAEQNIFLPLVSLEADNHSGSVPALEVIAMHRMAYGPRPGDLERVRQIGFNAYVDEQIAPVDDDDSELHTRLAQATLYIAYSAEGTYPDTEEQRPLRYLNAGLNDLWGLNNWEIEIPWEERIRPLEEVRVATWLRAIYSKWQLREVLVEFWHNHFNINAENDDTRIMVTWPIYDREVIRANALGNFRTMLEAVAQSTAMLAYLNNAESQASPANENYARELFELHTMGAMHYLNAQYEHWRDVPGAIEGNPIGYIDDDVYEAARAFTGWSVADGRWDARVELPNTGEFFYVDGWHDHYQKRVLGHELESHQAPLADGRRVLDLLAAHPATARYICGKLCRRLVADEPSPALIERIAQVWIAHRDAPDQIAQTVRAILLDAEFARTWGQKVRRPWEQAIAFLRALNTDFSPTVDASYLLQERGYQLFAWPAPNGHPDIAGYWLSTNVTLGRWTLPINLTQDWAGMPTLDLWAQTPVIARTAAQIGDYWIERLLGRSLSPADRTVVIGLLADGDVHLPLDRTDPDVSDRLRAFVTLIAMTPAFQER